MANPLQAVIDALRTPSAKPPGMVGQAAKQLSGRQYQLHVQEAQALGQTPLTPEQFAAQSGGQ